ncbi:hypothetical protein H7992_04975 [Sporosarcina sp. resist]|uniref:hypothetical protein n=1 Tax=Sporosarcina sp. resist TaxID=2762563 RepID=UPI00164D042D|nr:hypothetical protein [Sporosarcina sp. resist]QNK89081.1 hypothetical protein H7992_04975 [Sporosarcina sp. resist]
MEIMKKVKNETVFGKVKKVALTGTALAMMGGLFMAGGGQASASELKVNQGSYNHIEYLDAEILKQKNRESAEPYVSNGEDTVRRAALEKKFTIRLDESDTWVDKHLEDPAYTSHEVLKEIANYGVNASRQELIKYGIRADNWQPYYAFSAIESPAYYELIDGKFVQNKVYYGNLIESTFRSINQLKAEDNMRTSKINVDSIKVLEKTLEIRIADYKEAPGITPYVLGLNHNASVAKENGVETVGSDFYNSKWNHIDVMDKGQFRDKEMKKVD